MDEIVLNPGPNDLVRVRVRWRDSELELNTAMDTWGGFKFILYMKDGMTMRDCPVPEYTHIKYLLPANQDYVDDRPIMLAQVTYGLTAMKEAALCSVCFRGGENRAHAVEQASQADDWNPDTGFVECSENTELECCICGYRR